MVRNQGLRVRRSSVLGSTVLALEGVFRQAEVPQLREALGKVLADGPDCVVCELSRVTAADPTAMTMFAVARPAEGPGPVLCLAGARGDVAEVVDRLGLAHCLPVAANVADAVRIGRGPPRLHAVKRLPAHGYPTQLARQFARMACDAWTLGALADDAVQLANELVTHVLDRDGSDVLLRLEPAQDRLIVSAGPVPAIPGQRCGDAAGARIEDVGHTHPLVRALAPWTGSHTDFAGGRVVWAAVPIPGAGVEPAPAVDVRLPIKVKTDRVGRAGDHDP
jgi:hypothetical protein